ncbi:hypothetical protein MHYP_G00102960 [Metynnis hypsauchen]
MDANRDGGATLPQLAPPGKFDFSDANEWPRWLKRYERYRIATELDKKSDEFQVNAFMYAVGEEAGDILNVLPLTEEQKKSYKAVTDAFTVHCVSKRNVIFERARFNRRSQEPGESVESFITAVHTLAEHCEFAPLRDQLIRDRIVVGIKDAKLSESLQLDSELTLEKAMTRVRQSAAVKRQQPVLRGTEQQPGRVETVFKKSSERPKAEKGKSDTQPFGCSSHGTLQSSRKVLYGPGNHKLEVEGLFKGKLSFDNKVTEQDIYVVGGLAKPLLGLPAVKALALIKRVHAVQGQQEDFKALYPTEFSGLGKLKEPYKIELEPGAVPYALSTPRRVPLPLRDKVRAELNRMEGMGVISKVTKPTPWCAGLVVAPKAQPGKIRLCVDLTHLNKWVRRERHILPAVDHTLAMLAGAKVFTKLDATSGFWQIPLSEESSLLTTFITPFGRYSFNRLPFGISSAPEHFQRRMSQMLEGCEGAVCHADDIVVYGEDMQQHNARLHKVLQRLREEGLTLNEKCEFAKKQHYVCGPQSHSRRGDTRSGQNQSHHGDARTTKRRRGGVLSQQQEDGTWRPTVFISRGLTDAEKHYAQIEKEALAVTWACERLSPYLLGLQFKIETDHKPLVPLLSSKALDELPPRVLRFRLRLLKFTYDIVHVPGKCLITADALSRAPVKHTLTQEGKDNEADVKVFLDAVVQSLPATEARLKVIQEKQKTDPICAKLIQYCQTAWPERHALHPDLGPYWPERENLSMAGELLLRGQRIVIPQSMRKDILRNLHSGHQGIVKCRARARQSVWWPGLSVHISQLVDNCSICSQHRAEHREPLIPTPVQDRPRQRVGTDLFFWEKKTYLLLVDYFSRYIEVAHLSVATARTVIAALKDVFSRHGIPETVISDNGPQYSCELFRDFAEEYGFTHCTSSPRYPQANGEAERAVATVKGLWKGGEEKLKALMTYRATPLECGYSPAQLLMGRQLRTTIPQLPANLRPRWPNIRGLRKAETRAKEKQQRNYNLRHRARNLPPLQAGQNVWLAKERKSGTVVQQATTPRSYIIDTDEGQVRRNRTHVRIVDPPQQPTPPVTLSTPINPGNTVTTHTDNREHTCGTDVPYVTRVGRVSRPPDRLDL